MRPMTTDVTTATFRRFGAIPKGQNGIQWTVWAPKCQRVDLVLLGDRGRTVREMRRNEDGVFSHDEPDVAVGQRYVFRLDGGEDRADPASLWQPDGVPGPSAVVRPERFDWNDSDWRGVRREDLVIYELHIGTFTDAGTFDAAIERLPALKQLGITAIEIMPVNQFPGDRNWGYDGVLPYAAQNTYGGPHGLQRLVDACHREDLAVILDVVYNHFGPEGNFLHEFGPYFTDKYKTPWGKAVNYDDADSDPVRDYILDNARMWLEEFHFDGLRLDAVHAIYDMGARHILRSIREIADQVEQQTQRITHIIGESDLNDPKIILPMQRGGHGLDAQWSDDFHHTVHALLTREKRGYYMDYSEVQHLGKVMENPFLYAWNYSAHRRRKHGAPLPPDVTGDHFVVCIQNHDQVGNRAKGDRLSTLLDTPAKQRLAGSLLLLSPYIPMLFMGEEYGETRPFPFFCSFCGTELVEAVREGRKSEFADFVDSPDEIPDPHATQTFRSAKLSWSWPDGTIHGGLRRLYSDLLHARRRWPAMRDFSHRYARLLPDAHHAAIVELVRGNPEDPAGQVLRAYFNLSETRQPLTADRRENDVVLFTSESIDYGGERRSLTDVNELFPSECVVFGPRE
jgi:maltooligosyltrehalose trehalohydrolase